MWVSWCAHTLKVGDSISEEIGKALRTSRFGVLILTKHHLRKRWTMEELKTLFQLQVSSGEKIILPLWHDIEKEELMTRFPLLVDVKALSTSRFTLDQIADEICRVAERIGIEDEPQIHIHRDNMQLLFKPEPGTRRDQSYFVRTLRPAQRNELRWWLRGFPRQITA